MTEQAPTDLTIQERVDRIETIVEQLEAGDLSLEEGASLYEEGQRHIETLREDLEMGEGTVVDIDRES